MIMDCTILIRNIYIHFLVIRVFSSWFFVQYTSGFKETNRRKDKKERKKESEGKAEKTCQ